jgi:hypothetical protein
LKLKHLAIAIAVSDAQSESWMQMRTTPADVHIEGGLSAHVDAHAVERDVTPQGGTAPVSCMCPQQVVPAGQSDGIEQPMVAVAGQVLAQAFLSVVRLAQQTWLPVHRVVVPASPQWAPRPASRGPASTLPPSLVPLPLLDPEPLPLLEPALLPLLVLESVPPELLPLPEPEPLPLLVLESPPLDVPPLLDPLDGRSPDAALPLVEAEPLPAPELTPLVDPGAPLLPSPPPSCGLGTSVTP